MSITADFFRNRLDQMIDLRHPLAVLANRIPWQEIEASLAIRVTGKAPGTHDQIALERHGQTDLHAKLVRVAALALADAFHLWRVPAVELGAVMVSSPA